MSAPGEIWVQSEWAELRECVYGSPETWVLPKFLGDAKLRAQGGFGEFWQKNAGRDMAEADPELFARMRSHVQGAIDLLESLGVTVQVAGPISAANRKFPRGEDHGVSTPWMRDPFATIGNNVIEFAPRSLFHRRQRFAIRGILAQTMDRGARYFAQPDCGADDYVDAPGWGYLEGGDVFVLNDLVLVGHSGGCSNPEGARWLAHALGSGYRVETVPIDPMFPHLDCVLMTPREGLAVACMEALPDGLPEALKDWEVIEIPKALAKGHMGCNNLVLNDQTVVVPSEAPLDGVAEALAERSFEVLRIPYAVPCMVGGSFRCAHQPLIRR
jgi:N-dimethylarginine dimethylaminohydrolase